MVQTVRVVIQSRVSSTRLPGKVLLPIAGLPSIVLCARRASNRGLPVLVATSTDVSDDPLVRILYKYDIPYLRGSLDNVLDRFVKATADLCNDAIVIRLTADNLFPDGDFLQSMLQTYAHGGMDYLGTHWPQDALPYGLSAEVLSVRTLRRAARFAQFGSDLEHVTPWILRECVCKYYQPALYTNFGHLRATIDHLEDYLRVHEVFLPFADPVGISWHALCERLAALPNSSNFRLPGREMNGEFHSGMTLGTAQLGMPYGAANTRGQPGIEEAAKILRQAVLHGVACIDSASAYGTAEEVIGATFPPEYRDLVRIITKLDPSIGLEGESWGLSKARIASEHSVYRSLHRLGRRYLDTLLLHRWHHRQQFGGAIWSTLLELRRTGVIKRLGASICTPSEAVEALADPTVEHIQLPFNILDWRWRDKDFLAAIACRPDMVVHVRSVYLQGLLINSADCWPRLDGLDVDSCLGLLDSLVRRLRRVDRADLCVAYVRSHSWVTSTVIGVETSKQLARSLANFLNPPLTQSEREEVDRALPKVPVKLLDPSRWRL